MWKFIKSSSSNENKLNHDFNEICFIGRSNVGKSSLINALAKNNKLAKTSKTPGRTQLINYFSTEKGLIVVDLPGYGFARISKSKQEEMFQMVDEYFLKQKPKYVFLLIDSRHGIMDQDEKIINHLLSLNHNLILILTKTDKAKQSEIAKTLKHSHFKEIPYFLSSIEKKQHINKILDFIDDIEIKKDISL